MASKNSNSAFGQRILQGVQEKSASNVEEVNPAAQILAHRETSLSAIKSGKLLPDGNLLVDPARCRIWEHHNRDENWLSVETCGDLIESIKAEGRQRIPAIVRRVKDDPDFDYEVIAGRRRHWSVSWLRANQYENIEFLVTVQNLTDPEAFRIADFENRARKDLSDLERARDYAAALPRFFENSQQLMSSRLGVSKSWLSRYLALAKIDEVILSAFPNKYEIGISHATELSSYLKNETQLALMHMEAAALAADHEIAKQNSKRPMKPTEVVKRLIASTISKRQVEKIEPLELKSANGNVIATVKVGRNGGFQFRVLPNHGADRHELLQAFSEVLREQL